MRIITNDGATFSGPDAKAVVRAMKADDWNAPAKKRAYIVEVVDRVAQQFYVPDALLPKDDIPAEEFLVWLYTVGAIENIHGLEGRLPPRLTEISFENNTEIS